MSNGLHLEGRATGVSACPPTVAQPVGALLLQGAIMAHFVVINARKIKTAGGLKMAMAHNNRTREVPNADPAKAHLNHAVIAGTEAEVLHRQAALLKKVDRKIQDNAVRAISYVLTASHDFFDDRKKGEEFFRRSMAYMEKRHGRENIISAVIHEDERTPHLHVIVVPLHVKDKRYTNRKTHETKVTKTTALDAGHWLDGIKKCTEMRKSFAKEMEPLGLEYGTENVKRGKATHQEIAEWYRKTFGAGGADKAINNGLGKEEGKDSFYDLSEAEISMIEKQFSALGIPASPSATIWEKLAKMAYTELAGFGVDPTDDEVWDSVDGKIREVRKVIETAPKKEKPEPSMKPAYQRER